MNKKVLIITSSLREQSNSDILAEAFKNEKIYKVLYIQMI